MNKAMNNKRLLPIGLIGAAWLGIILCSFYAYAIDGAATLMSPTKYSMPWTTGSRLLLVAVLLLQLWNLWQLRGVGAILLHTPGISRELAVAFKRLGHSLLAFGLFGLAVPVPSLHRIPEQAYIGLERFSFPTLYLLAVGCLCIYATAWLVRESVQLQEDNEAFV